MQWSLQSPYWAMLLPRCPLCVNRRYSKSTTEIFCLSFAQGREVEFLTAAPQLFGPKFPGDVTKHLEQLATLRKAKASTFAFSESFNLPIRRAAKVFCTKTPSNAIYQVRKELGLQEGSDGLQMTIIFQKAQSNISMVFELVS